MPPSRDSNTDFDSWRWETCQWCTATGRLYIAAPNGEGDIPSECPNCSGTGKTLVAREGVPAVPEEWGEGTVGLDTVAALVFRRLF